MIYADEDITDDKALISALWLMRRKVKLLIVRGFREFEYLVQVFGGEAEIAYGLWYGVVAASAPWVASADTLYGKP